MVLKRDKDYIFFLCVSCFGCIAIFLIYILGLNASFGMALLFNAPVWVVVAIFNISSGRTFIMDAEGFTVVLWKYHRKYTWQELKTKKYDIRSMPSIRAYCPYTRGAMFSPRKLRRPKFISRDFYLVFHPFSCFYVNFIIENADYALGRHYEVKESVFREKMEEWGVILEE